MNATKETRKRAARDTPAPMPIFAGSSSRGLTTGLVVLLECGVGDVVELAVAGKDAELVVISDLVELDVAGKDAELVVISDVVELVIAGKNVGLVTIFCSLSAQPRAPKELKI